MPMIKKTIVAKREIIWKNYILFPYLLTQELTL
jgi:hypothetical protein